MTSQDLCCIGNEVHKVQEFEASREDIKNKNTEDLNVMKITLESTIDELEKKFEISHEAYLMQVCYLICHACTHHCALGTSTESSGYTCVVCLSLDSTVGACLACFCPLRACMFSSDTTENQARKNKGELLLRMLTRSVDGCLDLGTQS